MRRSPRWRDNGNQEAHGRFPFRLPLESAKKACRGRQASSASANLSALQSGRPDSNRRRPAWERGGRPNTDFAEHQRPSDDALLAPALANKLASERPHSGPRAAPVAKPLFINPLGSSAKRRLPRRGDFVPDFDSSHRAENASARGTIVEFDCRRFTIVPSNCNKKWDTSPAIPRQ